MYVNSKSYCDEIAAGGVTLICSKAFFKLTTERLTEGFGVPVCKYKSDPTIDKEKCAIEPVLHVPNKRRGWNKPPL